MNKNRSRKRNRKKGDKVGLLELLEKKPKNFVF